MKRQGFTLIELLIALAVLGIVLGIASSSIVQYLGIQSDQEAATSAQSRLRRATEIVSQELRGAILGAVIDTPYTANNSQLSVALLDGAAGYQVTSFGATTTTIISTATTAADTGFAANDVIMLVGSNGKAILRKINTLTQGSSGSNKWQLNHTSCTMPTSTSGNLPIEPLLFKVRTLGYKFNTASSSLFANERGVETNVAFNITGFNIDYIYLSNTGATHTLQAGATPNRTVTDGGITYTLDRLQVTMTAKERSRGKDVTRTYSNQIDLVDNSKFLTTTNSSKSYSIQGVTVCN
jgi:prepilin-type N-terminal cleavage/methylation domain-containing protein